MKQTQIIKIICLTVKHIWVQFLTTDYCEVTINFYLAFNLLKPWCSILLLVCKEFKIPLKINLKSNATLTSSISKTVQNLNHSLGHG